MGLSCISGAASIGSSLSGCLSVHAAHLPACRWQCTRTLQGRSTASQGCAPTWAACCRCARAAQQLHCSVGTQSARARSGQAAAPTAALGAPSWPDLVCGANSSSCGCSLPAARALTNLMRATHPCLHPARACIHNPSSLHTAHPPTYPPHPHSGTQKPENSTARATGHASAPRVRTCPGRPPST